MHSFRRAFKTVTLFVVAVALFASIIMLPLKLGFSGYDDSKARKSMTGTIDTLFCGASFACNSFNPSIYDQITGDTSYNLSGFRISFTGRYELLKKEIERNPIKTVYLEIACDTFVRNPNEEKAKGEAMTICRLDGFMEKLSYIVDNVSLANDEIDTVSCVALGYGVGAWISLLKNDIPDIFNNRGYWSEPSIDVSLQGREDIEENYRTHTLSEFWYTEYVDAFNNIVELCKTNDVNLVVVVTPLSDAYLWKYRNMDNFHTNLLNLCNDHQIQLLDFNLLKSKEEYFDDRISFCNETHMSTFGAEQFTTNFAQICNSLEFKSVDDLFYGSYEDALKFSPYIEGMQ